MYTCQSDDANRPLWPPGGLQEVLREDDPDSRVTAPVAVALRHLQGKDTEVKGKRVICCCFFNAHTCVCMHFYLFT